MARNWLFSKFAEGLVSAGIFMSFLLTLELFQSWGTSETWWEWTHLEGLTPIFSEFVVCQFSWTGTTFPRILVSVIPDQVRHMENCIWMEIWKQQQLGFEVACGTSDTVAAHCHSVTVLQVHVQAHSSSISQGSPCSVFLSPGAGVCLVLSEASAASAVTHIILVGNSKK